MCNKKILQKDIWVSNNTNSNFNENTQIITNNNWWAVSIATEKSFKVI